MTLNVLTQSSNFNYISVIEWKLLNEQVATNLARTLTRRMQKFKMATILVLQVEFSKNLIRPKSTCRYKAKCDWKNGRSGQDSPTKN